ncbi:ABC transporter permease [Marinibaculum pumilum]|uniref:ABC transporter permease n=1 Tax=Marinibaculum pumilum TaxID=1766165 RepID=A0ABV7KTW0_9PROT
MSPDIVVAVLLTIIAASTPLLLAAIGELVAERSGVLNLGVEGMMIVGAAAGFAGAQVAGSAYVGVLCAALAGVALSILFAILVLVFTTNQVATGLSITLLGIGIAGLVGQGYVGTPGVKLRALEIPLLSEIPVLGRLLFSHDILVYLSVILVAAVAWILARTRLGLTIRAVGDNHHSAHAIGYNVVAVRFLAVMFGGLCAGLAGGYLSLVYTPQWVEGMSAGRGWIAVALVVFAAWRPVRAFFGAYLFGAVVILQFHAQAAGVQIPSQFLSALPYIATIVVLVVISASRRSAQGAAPACLGQPFVP